MCSSHYISSVPLSLSSVRRRVESFLAENGLRIAPLDYYAIVTRNEDSDEILAGGGLEGNVMKCIAVSESARAEGLTNKLVSHLIGVAMDKGHQSVKVFTKPGNQGIFSSLGFQLLATSPEAILMENGFTGLKSYLKYLSGLRKDGRNGAIVMNANPFTKGHRYLVEQAAAQVDNLYVIAVKEDRSRFPYVERLAMIKAGTADLGNVTVCEGSDYAISAATFPTYFLKKLDDASDTQMTLDIDLFSKHIAPALGVSVRFAGSEPVDPLTGRYNQLMSELLPQKGMEFVEIQRLEDGDAAISASRLRNSLDIGMSENALRLAYQTSIPYLVADLAQRALERELDTTPKPGLVDKDDRGAHQDMDHGTMVRSILALRPFFTSLALAAVDGIDPDKVRETGIEAEKAMLMATCGVNTHKGALFCLGLSAAVVSFLLARDGKVGRDEFRRVLARTAEGIPSAKDTHGADAVNTYRVPGALESARRAYPGLFSDWLPYYNSLSHDQYREHKTLLKIMTMLDDTNILHRNGLEGIRKVKADAASILADFSVDRLSELNNEYKASNTSPGGSADMLSLTIYISNFIN